MLLDDPRISGDPILRTTSQPALFIATIAVNYYYVAVDPSGEHSQAGPVGVSELGQAATVHYLTQYPSIVIRYDTHMDTDSTLVVF